MARVRNHNAVVVSGESQAAVHQEMFATLLRTPHRMVDEVLQIHRDQFARDPDFYGRLATWATHLQNNSVRDVNHAFIAMLFTSEYQEHRDAAYVMLQELPPYEVWQILNLYTGYDEIVRWSSISGKKLPENKKFGVTLERAKYAKNHALAGQLIPRKAVTLTDKVQKQLVAKGKVSREQKEYYVDTYLLHHQGLGRKNVRGTMRQAIRTYLRYRERPENQRQMEGAMLRAWDMMRRLYSKTNTLPMNDEESWINQYLFKGRKTTDGTRFHSLRQLSLTNDPIQQAEIILDAKLPLPLAINLVKSFTPSVWVALITVATPQELLQHLGMMQKKGVFDNTDLKALVESKLSEVQSKKVKVDALKAQHAVAAVKGLDEDIVSSAKQVTDSQLKFHGKITAKTALLIDKSASMEKAIDMGKEIGATIAQSCEKGNEPICYLFDASPVPVIWNAADGDTNKKSSWDKKLKMVRANGGTNPAGVIRAMISQNTRVEQIVLVTDEGENTVGMFASQLKDYERHFGTMPNIVIVRVGDSTVSYPYGVSDVMEKSCRAAGIEVEVLDCTKSDSVSIPNLLQMLSRKSIFDLVLEIRQLPLPSRVEWDKEHGMIR